MFLNKPELAAVHVLASIKNSRSRSMCCSVSLLILRVSPAGGRVNTASQSELLCYNGLYRRHPPWMARVGEWLSLVEHLVRDQGVGGSNPLSPTNLFNHLQLISGVPSTAL